MESNFINKNAIFSLELFPPKDIVGIQAIYENMPIFASLNPDFISVTYGAGGSSVGTTVEITSKIKQQFNINSVAHLTCAGSTKETVQNVLDGLKQNGVNNILALRGDLNKGRTVSDFTYATDLINYINTNNYFNVSAACYPEGHPESKNIKEDINVLKMKSELGVTHFISQLFFDNNDFYRFLELADIANITAPIEAGIMPITNPKQILRIVELSGAKLPSKLTKLISKYENNPIALRQAGLNFAIEQITDLLTNGVRGIHLYTMNNPTIATAIYNSISPILDDLNSR